MDGWTKISSSFNNLNLSQASTKFSKGFSSSVQATRERLGQVSPDEITELPQGAHRATIRYAFLIDHIFAEYKDLEARVDALKAAHLAMLKSVSFHIHVFHFLFFC